MKDVIDAFGQTAGKIWRALNESGPLSESELIKKIRVNKNDFYAGVGWLARENKIAKEGSKYKLSETNLTEKIGTDAGKIWHTLNSNKDINITTIAKISNLSIKEAYSALGWLAREDKLKINYKNKQVRYELKV